MDDFPGLLARDFGFRAQGKAAPMAASKGSSNISSGGTLNFGIGSGGDTRSSSFSSSNRSKSGWNSNSVGSSFLDDQDGLFKSSNNQKSHDFDGLGGYGDVFGGPPKYTNKSDARSGASSFDYDSIFQGKDSGASLPVFDKPVYDDDIFDGVPGLKSSSSMKYDDVFSSISSPPKQSHHYDDLLGNLGRKERPESKNSVGKRSGKVNKDVSDFDDLIPGFGGSSPPKNRATPQTSQPQQSTVPSNKSTSVVEDPFVVLESSSVPVYASPELFNDPLEHINKPGSKSFDTSSASGVFNDTSPLDDFANSMPSFSSSMKSRGEDKSPSRTGSNATSTHRAAGEEPIEEPSMKTANNYSQKVDVSPKSEGNFDSADDIWLTVSEIPLFTQPTSTPPPSRPPPPRPVQVSKADKEASLSAGNAKEKVNDFSSFQHFSQNFQSPTTDPVSGRNTGVSSIDELEDFAMGRSRDNTDEHSDVFSSEEDVDVNSAAAASAAAMKEAMDKAEAKFKHAREVRERESARTAKTREAYQQEKDEKALHDAQERELREKQERLDREREQREREQKEREKRRLEKERERARQAVERATREARERAAAEARAKAEKAAVEKANAEARERAERAAVQRAQAEARERAASDARERAERAAAEARERSNAEARDRAAAVARAEAEVRLRAERASAEKAAAEARERAAAAARENQQKNENDLESFFGMGTRASSAPRPRTTNSDSAFDSQFRNKEVPEGARRTSSGTSSNIRKASSTTNIVDDLTSIFGGAPSSGEFQEIDGETEERRRARLERHQRTQDRAAKALAEKNQRDLQNQREQAERHRIAETLDIEIKRWAAGKEGNLRALLSTLQYVLWAECGWQPVSLTDLITAASVKKVYRKATLCIHPDKVQQKGANLQQKYVAEKVFDLLKEAWNKFNSEELF